MPRDDEFLDEGGERSERDTVSGSMQGPWWNWLALSVMSEMCLAKLRMGFPYYDQGTPLELSWSWSRQGSGINGDWIGDEFVV